MCAYKKLSVFIDNLCIDNLCIDNLCIDSLSTSFVTKPQNLIYISALFEGGGGLLT